MRALAALLLHTATALPPLKCDREEQHGAAWRAIRNEAVWSRRTFEAVERLLTTKSSQTLKRPRVYVYPFPPSFENASNLWAAAGLDQQGASLFFQGRKHDYPGSYFQIAYGAKGPYHAHSRWRHAKDGLRWTPGWPLFSEELQSGHIDGSTCQFMRQPSQHITGLIVHRALTHWPKLVDDPSQAELFFVPDHACRRGRGAGKNDRRDVVDATALDGVAPRRPATTSPQTLDVFRKLCRAEGEMWLRHLASYKDAHGRSLLERNQGRDHFFSRNRAWHYAQPTTYEQDYEFSTKRHHQGDECAWTHAGLVKRSGKLMLETQAPYQRSIARHHPVPYLSPQTLSMISEQSARCSYRNDGNMRSRRRWRVAVLIGGTRGSINDENREQGSASRRRFLAQCEAWDACVSSRPVPAGGGKPTTTYSEIYLQSDFCVQPPGHSAARKGIVDALIAGCIPVLFRPSIPKDGFSPWDQRDLWPWHWAWQSATSVEVTSDDLDGKGLKGVLDAVTDDQLELMRRAIRREAHSLLWPLNATDAARNDALSITLHHLAHLAEEMQHGPVQELCSAPLSAERQAPPPKRIGSTGREIYQAKSPSDEVPPPLSGSDVFRPLAADAFAPAAPRKKRRGDAVFAFGGLRRRLRRWRGDGSRMGESGRTADEVFTRVDENRDQLLSKTEMLWFEKNFFAQRTPEPYRDGCFKRHSVELADAWKQKLVPTVARAEVRGVPKQKIVAFANCLLGASSHRDRRAKAREIASLKGWDI